MIRKSVISLVFVLAAGFQLKAAEDFEQSYTVVPGRLIVINNRMGDVKVTGYGGEDIKISAHKKGPDEDSIQIVDKSFGPQIHLFPVCSKLKSSETRVDFEVKVPKSTKPVFINLNLKSESGNIEVTDFSGGLEAVSSRGSIKVVNVDGFVKARSNSGDMYADIKQAKGRSQMMFSSLSGDIKVTAPKDFSAWVTIKNSSGNLKTDFPLEHNQRRYGEHTAGGKLGSGTQMLHITSVSGNVSLMKE